MSSSAFALVILLSQVGISAGGPGAFRTVQKVSPELKVRALSKVTPEVKNVQPSMHDRDEALRSNMRAMMQDDDADDDVWYGEKPKNGLIQTGLDSGMSLNDEYMQESTKALSSALGPRWDSKVVEENADRTTKAFLNGISSPKALGSLHAMMGAMGALR